MPLSDRGPEPEPELALVVDVEPDVDADPEPLPPASSGGGAAPLLQAAARARMLRPMGEEPERVRIEVSRLLHGARSRLDPHD